jgi:hypothetical protein
MSARPVVIATTFLILPLRMSGKKRLYKWMLPTTLVLKLSVRSRVRWSGSWPRTERGSKADQEVRKAAFAMRTSRLPEVIMDVAAAAFWKCCVREFWLELLRPMHLQGLVAIKIAFEDVDVGCLPRRDFGFCFGDVAYDTDDGVGGVAGEGLDERELYVSVNQRQ